MLRCVARGGCRAGRGELLTAGVSATVAADGRHTACAGRTLDNGKRAAEPSEASVTTSGGFDRGNRIVCLAHGRQYALQNGATEWILKEEFLATLNIGQGQLRVSPSKMGQSAVNVGLGTLASLARARSKSAIARA